jgi:hypothetical protein
VEGLENGGRRAVSQAVGELREVEEMLVRLSKPSEAMQDADSSSK